MISTPIKVAIYVRVSTEEQAEHGYSIEAQLETLRDYCKLYGKELFEEYVDAGISGKSIEGRYYVNWSDKRRRGKSTQPIIVEGQHEAIVTNDLWNKVQFLIQKRSITPSRIFDGEFLLTGLIRCPQCGAAMVASRTKSKSKSGEIKNHLYYSCGAFRNKGSRKLKKKS